MPLTELTTRTPTKLSCQPAPLLEALSLTSLSQTRDSRWWWGGRARAAPGYQVSFRIMPVAVTPLLGQALRPKDRIVEVNGLRGDVLQLVDECKKPKALLGGSSWGLFLGALLGLFGGCGQGVSSGSIGSLKMQSRPLLRLHRS